MAPPYAIPVFNYSTGTIAGMNRDQGGTVVLCNVVLVDWSIPVSRTRSYWSTLHCTGTVVLGAYHAGETRTVRCTVPGYLYC